MKTKTKVSTAVTTVFLLGVIALAAAAGFAAIQKNEPRFENAGTIAGGYTPGYTTGTTGGYTPGYSPVSIPINFFKKWLDR